MTNNFRCWTDRSATFRVVPPPAVRSDREEVLLPCNPIEQMLNKSRKLRVAALVMNLGWVIRDELAMQQQLIA
ncbi:hypothetical protein FXO38_28528 [Capsicum annuum]|nr:hypothetical protein FXO38_28528 [Capsicum annuum]